MRAENKHFTNDCKKVIVKSCKVIEWVIFLSLLIAVGLFVQDVWFDYLSKATSVKQYSEIYNELEVCSSYIHHTIPSFVK